MIEVVIEDEAWATTLPEAQKIADECLLATAGSEPDLKGEIALLMTDDAHIRVLNSQFREKDKPTNVLSFPGDGGAFLGDIALARETCVREAAEKGIVLKDHAAHLIIHAMLHLLGYDHETEEDATEMEGRETAILASMGIADPYGES